MRLAINERTGMKVTGKSSWETPDISAEEGATPAPEWPAGTALGRYLLLEKLGDGGMGVIYSAYDPKLDRKIAIKLLRARDTGALTPGGGGQMRLLREAQAMARISHPNVVSVFDVGTFEDRVFVAMELIEGHNVRQWLAAEPRDWSEVLRIYLDAGRGLAAAHKAGLVHRDFKPDNVLVGKHHRVSVTDFGLARLSLVEAPSQPELLRDEGASEAGAGLSGTVTRAGLIPGTPAYMAPEQHRGRMPDARSDQFSFCVSLWEGLFGRRPFNTEQLRTMGDKLGTAALSELLRPSQDSGVTQEGQSSAARPVTLQVPWRSVRIRRILLRGLSPRPEDRYPSMAELLAELEKDPRRLRRRWMLAIGAVVMGAVLVSGLMRAREEQGRRCQGAEARLTGTWDSGRREAIRSAFLLTGQPYAADTFDRVARALDQRARDWAAMRTEACEATAIRGEQSPALLDLRMACLDRRLSEMQALTDLFARADAQVVEKAVVAVGQLLPIKGCGDIPALTAAIKPPESAELRERVEALRKQLDQAKALYDAGKYAEGLKIAAAVVEETKKLHYRPIQAEALLRLGVLQAETGDRNAEATLFEADLAAEASRHDEIAAQAVTKLIFVVGFVLGRTEEGHRWARRVSAILERMGDNGLLTAHYLNDLGAVYFAEKRYAEAADHFLRSEQIKERELGPEHRDIAISMANLGLAYTRMDKHAEALACLRRAVAINEKALSPDHPAVSLSLVNLAVLDTKLGNYAEAAAHARRALAVVEAASNPGSDYLALALEALGEAYGSQGKYPEALQQYERALGVRKKLDGPESQKYASVLLKMGHLYLDQHAPARAAPYFQEAMQVQEKVLPPRHPELARPLAALGRLRLERGEPAQAAAVLERALVLAQGAPANVTAIAQVRFLLAQALWKLGRDPRRALDLARQARQAYVQTGRAQDAADIDGWLTRAENSRMAPEDIRGKGG